MAYFSAYANDSLTRGYHELGAAVVAGYREALQLLDEDRDATVLHAAIDGMSGKLLGLHQQFDDRIYAIRIGAGVTGQDISTMLNTSRELYLSARAWLLALREYVAG